MHAPNLVEIEHQKEPKWASFGREERKKYYNPEQFKKVESFDFDNNKWRLFKNLKELEDFSNKHGGQSGAAGEEKVWFRYGNLPRSNRSTNFQENKCEDGVSVYATPSGSSPFFANRDIYFGKGRQVGWGSDGEPIIIPTDVWIKYDIAKARV